MYSTVMAFFELTGEASWSAILFGINRLTTIFLMPFARGERSNKKQLMVWMDWIRGICAGMIPVVSFGVGD